MISAPKRRVYTRVDFAKSRKCGGGSEIPKSHDNRTLLQPPASDHRHSTAELAFFVFEEKVEGRQRAVAARDVLLHFDFFAVAELFVGVDFLFQDAELV